MNKFFEKLNQGLSRSCEREVVGSATTQTIWIGGDAYTAVAVAKKTGTGSWAVYNIFRDHLGTITHLKTGSTITEYSFDAWGRRRNALNWSYDLTGQPALFADRGFTGHEFLADFNLYNMNGRLYDPVVGRFLSPDENIQLPGFTQNYNRYSYALNNPLVYTDPSGEYALIDDLGAMLLGGIINWGFNGFKFNNAGLGYFVTGALAAEATLYTGPLGGAAVLGAGNDLTHQVSQNGWNNIDLWQTANSTAMSMATSYLGGQLGSKFAPGFSKFASNISSSPVVQGAITQGLTNSATGFTLTAGLSLAGGESLKTSLNEGGKGALSGLGIGLTIGAISGYKYALDEGIDPWNSEKIQKHHSDPMFAGGEPNQQLTPLRQSTHKKLHSDMNDFLYEQRDAYGNHMRPQSNNSGRQIRFNFERPQLQNSLKLFYDNNKWTYPRSRYDFYRNNNLKWWPW